MCVARWVGRFRGTSLPDTPFIRGGLGARGQHGVMDSGLTELNATSPAAKNTPPSPAAGIHQWTPERINSSREKLGSTGSARGQHRVSTASARGQHGSHGVPSFPLRKAFLFRRTTYF